MPIFLLFCYILSTLQNGIGCALITQFLLPLLLYVFAALSFLLFIHLSFILILSHRAGARGTHTHQRILHFLIRPSHVYEMGGNAGTYTETVYPQTYCDVPQLRQPPPLLNLQELFHLVLNRRNENVICGRCGVPGSG